jgi:hypothetical protein
MCSIRAEPWFEIEFELCESDRELMAALLPLFLNDNFHLLGFFVTAGQAAGIDTVTGTSGRGGLRRYIRE